MLQLGPLAERVIVGISVVMSASTLYAGWRVHRRWLPWLVWADGLVIWLLALGGLVPDWLGGTVGGGSVAFAAFHSGILLRASGHPECTCPACDLAAEDSVIPSDA
jgi:hypothetical protein